MAYIVRQRMKGGRVSVYLAENHYDGEKKQARQKRTYLGVLNEESGELLLSANSVKPGKEIIQLLEQKGIFYKGEKASRPGRKKVFTSKGLTAEDIQKSVVVETGRLDVLSHLARESKVLDALKESFGKLGERIFFAAVHMVCEGSPLYLAADWAEDIGIQSSLSSSSLSRLTGEIGFDMASVNDFFTRWIDYCGKPEALIHDTTSISSYSEELDLAEWGYNRDEENLPQVNLALVVAKESRLPIWFRILPGSIPDVSSLKLTSKMLKELGLSSFSFSLDRGYFSTSNLVAMLNSGVDFTIGVPLSVKQAKDLIRKHRNSLRSSKYSFLYNGDRLRHVQCSYTVTKSKNETVTLPAHLYFDPDRKEKSAKRIETAILSIEAKSESMIFDTLQEATLWIKENAAKLASFFSVLQKNQQWVVRKKPNLIASATNNMGMTLILTTKQQYGNITTMDEYRCRDIAEKLFDSAKNAIGSDRLRTNDPHVVQGRLFIAFIALILRSLFESKLKTSGLLKNTSVDEALQLLKKIKCITLPGGSKVTLEIPKKARVIAKAAGLDLE